jgi:hypothetical protein
MEAPHRSRETLASYLQTVSDTYAHPDVTMQAEVISGDPASVIGDIGAWPATSCEVG